MDEFAVELGVPLGGTPVLVHKTAQPLPGLLGHGGIGLPLLFIQVHGLAVQLQLLLRLLPVLLQLLLPLHLLLGLTAHGLLRDEKAVEGPVKGNLLLPGFGVDGPQGGFHPLSVVKAQGNQQAAGILGFLGADAQALHPKNAGKGGEFFQVNLRLSHGGVLRSCRRTGRCAAGVPRRPNPWHPGPRCF